MKASNVILADFLKQQGVRFVIPVYQRPYSWTDYQCKQLLTDLNFVVKHKKISHFLGSIVHIDDGQMSGHLTNSLKDLLIIDGQQRLTTISLLLMAIGRLNVKKHIEKDITNLYLRNYVSISKNKLKIILNQQDQKALEAIDQNKNFCYYSGTPDIPYFGKI
jgi:uncharacterized protein with ParB-like and HNH nuclease domain